MYGQPDHDMTGQDSQGSRETRKNDKWQKLDSMDVQTEKKTLNHGGAAEGNVVPRRSSRSINRGSMLESAAKRSRKLEKTPALTQYITDGKAKMQRISSNNNIASSQSAHKVMKRVLDDDLRDSVSDQSPANVIGLKAPSQNIYDQWTDQDLTKKDEAK